MPPVQTSYPTRPAAAYEGMAADQNPATILSRTVETPEGIGFGRAAFQGAPVTRASPPPARSSAASCWPTATRGRPERRRPLRQGARPRP